ncbi:hypothetical protein R1sor_011877 [Riccia sorocarpa]|uniref:CCHC-type domain-containing protein n=1 Tax=Riccia sorocarpa TaxID=122646 RepID=A0ABD3I3G3_9MARC
MANVGSGGSSSSDGVSHGMHRDRFRKPSEGRNEVQTREVLHEDPAFTNPKGNVEGGQSRDKEILGVGPVADPHGFRAWRGFQETERTGQRRSNSIGTEKPQEKSSADNETDWAIGVTWSMIAEELAVLPLASNEAGDDDGLVCEIHLDVSKAASRLGRLRKTAVFEEDRKAAMDRPPCFLDGRVIRMLEWDAKANDKIPHHLRAAWVELRGVPPCLEDQITAMLEALGPVIHQTLDKSEEVKYANVRACVMLDMAVELPKAVGIVTPWKTKHLQAVTYTRLPDRCYVCHISGHMARQCPTKRVIPTSGVMGANATRGEVAKQSGESVSSKEVTSSKDKEEADGFEVVSRKGSSQLNKGRRAVASPTRSVSNRFNALAEEEEEIESDASWVADSSLDKREDKLEATVGHNSVRISPVKVRLSQEPIVDHNWVRKLELLRKQEEVVQAMEQEVSMLHANLEAHRRKEGEQRKEVETVGGYEVVEAAEEEIHEMEQNLIVHNDSLASLDAENLGRAV